MRSLDEDRRIFRTVSGEKVAVFICHLRGDKTNIGNEIDEQPRIQFKICVNRSDLQLIVFQHLCQPHTLHACKCEIKFTRDTLLKKV